ncbi:MAG: histidinol phosphate phosphatase [Alphaproteobacteria bacterium]|nr:histidinol phosphate phosphatase [Alphaproteobacteria bacterium]
MGNSESNINELNTAIMAVKVAGIEAMKLFRNHTLTIDYKADASPVTFADKAAEKAVCLVIGRDYPDDAIVGEEMGGKLRKTGRQWVIDPIDGTKSFAVGNPLFGNMVAFCDNAVPQCSAIYICALDMLYYGDAKNRQSFLQIGQAPPKKIKTNQHVKKLSNAKLLTTSPDLFSPASRLLFNNIAKQCAFTNYGGDCHNYMLVASGFADLVMEEGLKSHDILPLLPILQGSNCVVSDWQGEEITYNGTDNGETDGQILVSSNDSLHQKALAIIATS